MFDFWVGVLFLIFFGDDLGVSTSFLASFLSRCCHLKNSLLEDAKIMFHFWVGVLFLIFLETI